MVALVLLSLCLMNLVLSESNLYMDLTTPCPDIFQYRYDSSGDLIGLIEIQPPNGNAIQLFLELSVGNSVQGYNGNIELVQHKEKVIEDIMNRKPIFYKVHFPVWRRIPPRVTKIIVNGELICSGPKFSLDQFQVLTTINLQHTLKIDVTPLRVDVQPSNNVRKGVSTPNLSNFFDFNTKQGDSNFNGGVGGFGMSFGGNSFNFNPNVGASSKGEVPRNNFNFNPQMPKDPTRIFAGNPFFTRTKTYNGSAEVQNQGKVVSGSGLQNTFVNRDQNSNTFASRATTPPQNIPPTTEPPIPPPTQLPVRPTSNPSRGSFKDICGRSIPTNSLIVHGGSVPRGAYPWLAALFEVKQSGLTYACSASLISNRHVVTAAHCVRKDSRNVKPEDLLIILGKLNIQKWRPTSSERMIEPESVHPHPDYEPLSADADIAVIVLSEAVTFTRYIRPICLWPGNTDLNLIVGLSGTVVGWGRDETGVIRTSEPKQISLPIVSQEECLRSAYQFRDITSHRTFCAGNKNGSGPCNGDSGSGFIMQQKEVWYLRGVVSMSISDTHTRSCDLSNYVVFTDASKYNEWILSFIQ